MKETDYNDDLLEADEFECTRILVVSDSHRKSENVEKAISLAGHIDYLIHLGDSEASIDELMKMVPGEVKAYFVRGNCDTDSKAKNTVFFEIENKNIMCVHGHMHGVKIDTDRLMQSAKDNKCQIALFGHTHEPLYEKKGIITLFNPGSVSIPHQKGYEKTYGIIEITDFGYAQFKRCYLDTPEKDYYL